MNVVVGVVRMTCWIQGLARAALVEPTGTKGSAGRAGDGETGESIGYGELDAAHLYRGRKSAVAHPHLRNGEGRKGREGKSDGQGRRRVPWLRLEVGPTC